MIFRGLTYKRTFQIDAPQGLECNINLDSYTPYAGADGRRRLLQMNETFTIGKLTSSRFSYYLDLNWFSSSVR